MTKIIYIGVIILLIGCSNANNPAFGIYTGTINHDGLGQSSSEVELSAMEGNTVHFRVSSVYGEFFMGNVTIDGNYPSIAFHQTALVIQDGSLAYLNGGIQDNHLWFDYKVKLGSIKSGSWDGFK